MITGSTLKKCGWLFFALSFLLAACGGSTGSSSNNSTTTETGSTGGGGGSNGGGITVSNIHSSAKELGVGDVLFVDLNNSTSLDFNGVNSKAEFSFALINAAESGGNLAVTMTGDLALEELDVVKAMSYEEFSGESAEEPEIAFNDISEDFHNFLRDQEKELEVLEIPEDSFSLGKSAGGSGGPVAPAVSLGDRQSFKVLSSLSSTTGYREVSATAECLGDNVLFYVDEEVSADILSDADIAQLCDYFDPIARREQELFGEVSDVDGNGKVVVLFTPQVNRLGASGGGIITGFFLANDLYAPSASSPASNNMEILYIMVPDPNGAWGTAISRAFAMSNLLPTVLPHELQHAINYNQHVFVARGQAEVSCLNEGLSHMAEDLMGQGQENSSRYAIYLRSPQSYSIASCSSAGLGSRGGTYLFLRYLFEQSGNGNAFVRRLIQSPFKGVENLEEAFDGTQADFDQFGEFFLRWAVVLTGVTEDPRFSFEDRTRDSATGQWMGACVTCNPEDGRGTALNGVAMTVYRGSLNAETRFSALRFFKLQGIQDAIHFQNLGRGGEGYGVLIRTK